MKLWSISFAYRLGLGFHALNNEGNDGSNLMQPRRIDVGRVTYDGISGEMVRHQILEQFVNQCRSQDISILPLSEGLHPDRGPLGIRAAAKTLGYDQLTNENLFPSVRQAIASCAMLDIGGFLAAWKPQERGSAEKYIAETPYIEKYCAEPGNATPVKRESCFDAAWLISEAPQDFTITQHSTFRDTPTMNNRYSQTMRSNVYGGVIRAELHRIGTDDHWYLQPEQERLTISEAAQRKRQEALLEAIAHFIASPSGAKTAAWAPHVFLVEGMALLTSARTAPFTSPIKVTLDNPEMPVQPNKSYGEVMQRLANNKDTWVWKFSDAKELLDIVNNALAKLGDV